VTVPLSALATKRGKPVSKGAIFAAPSNSVKKRRSPVVLQIFAAGNLKLARSARTKPTLPEVMPNIRQRPKIANDMLRAL